MSEYRAVYTSVNYGYYVSLLESIVTKNDALLNIRHPSEKVRAHCEYILRGLEKKK